MTKSLFLERAMFVVAPQNSGKSTSLLSMHLDRRLGTDGKVPKSRDCREIHYLSNERRLYLRLTSPHEYGETLDEFLEKTRKKMKSGRWCYAGPFHPDGLKKMPDALTSVKGFVEFFEPERVRVVLLSPDRHGVRHDDKRTLVSDLKKVRGVEVIFVDAQKRDSNGLVLADFFDFT